MVTEGPSLHMNEPGYTTLILRFLRSVILIDGLLAMGLGVIGFLAHWRTVEAFGMALLWMGTILMVFASFIMVGGFTARVKDADAYFITHAGNMSENMRHIADSRHSSLGCFLVLLAAGLGLRTLGYVLPVIFLLLQSSLVSAG